MTIFKKKTLKDYIIYTAIILFGVLIDQFTKWLAVKFLQPIPTFPLIEKVLHLTYVENTGAAFGMLKDHRWVFITISTLAILAFIAYLYLGHAETTLYGVGMSMIISGGIGNMIDRLAFGYVVDFIDFRLINFAIFNGADSIVCIGAGVMVLALILDMKKEIKAEREKKAAAEKIAEEKE